MSAVRGKREAYRTARLGRGQRITVVQSILCRAADRTARPGRGDGLLS